MIAHKMADQAAFLRLLEHTLSLHLHGLELMSILKVGKTPCIPAADRAMNMI
jgi:hypothetical protein